AGPCGGVRLPQSGPGAAVQRIAGGCNLGPALASVQHLPTARRAGPMRKMMLVAAVTCTSLAVWASSAAAVEIGECVPQKAGSYWGPACSATRSEPTWGPHEWRQVTPPLNTYTDEHPKAIDEKQIIAGEGVRLECKNSIVFGEVTSFTTNEQVIHDMK